MGRLLKRGFWIFMISYGIYLILISLVSYSKKYTLDPYYSKLLSTHSGSLILGTSRAGQGIEPEILNRGNYLPFFNFAFTVGHTPYGEPYYDLIKKKIKVDDLKTNRLFIVTVDPWSLQGSKVIGFPETRLFTGELVLPFSDPNLEYLIKFYEDPLFGPILNEKRHYSTSPNGRKLWNKGLHNKLDSEIFSVRLKEYESWIETKGYLSKERLASLETIVQFLQGYGQVVLVRIPVNEDFLFLENSNFPTFDQVIEERFPELPYLNYCFPRNSNKFQFTDGSHLTRSSGNHFSSILLDDLDSLFSMTHEP
ncbi:MAG: hypothetical protein LPK47_11855, partial [Bacteroidota bacterium]|nr:hypothetical protein [Bacteroidota bacterium]